ncbi:MAG: InlB B-repeat-containing protein [Candidatus Hermodarchaeia archaeon]
MQVTPSVNSESVINVWYGLSQTFGLIGNPQEWINILGNVSDPDGVDTLEYSLNGGPDLPLTLGPNNPRLASPGDFNIEIAVVDLNVGLNQVVIKATDDLSNVTTETVSVEYISGNVWPLPYTIDWSAQTDITDVAQIVDGLWTLEADSVRPAILGYDRLIAIGETTWTDFEVVVPITVHATPFTNTGGIGVIVRWQGHFLEGSEQPRTGWTRIGAYGYYRYRDAGDHLALRIDGSDPIKDFSVQLVNGTTYMLKVRVDTLPGEDGGFYSLKIWEQGDPEPVAWNLTDQDGSSDIDDGSMLLVAHKIDASIGDVSATPNDTTTYPLTVNIVGSGNVVKNPDKASYDYGEEVLLTANPDADWSFDGWSGSLSSTDNPLSITITGSHELTANFAFHVFMPLVVREN